MIEFQRHEGGWGWLVDNETGLIWCEHKPQAAAHITYNRQSGPLPEGEPDLYLYRTIGEPTTIREIFDKFGDAIFEASDRFDIAPQLIAACICIEAVRGNGHRRDPLSYRYEPRPDDSSLGLMQTMCATAEDRRREHFPDWPPIPVGGPIAKADRPTHPLADPRVSILLGAAHMAHERDTVERDELDAPNDPIRNYVGAYNAGSVRTSDNVWNLRTYSPHRVDRFIAFNNDAVAVLGERGIWTGIV